MNKTFDVSVIVPVYNVARYLQEAIDSVLRQTIGFEDHIQLILVNDGSADNSAEICRRCKDAHPDNVVFIDKPNGGVSSARNAGLAAARGRYVNFLDGDDVWTPDAFQKMLDFIEPRRDQIDLVCCREVYFEAKTGYHNLDARFRKGDRVVDVRETPQFFTMRVSTSLIKTEAAQARRFDERISYGEDAKFVIGITLEKGRYGVLKSAEYRIRRRADEDSLTQSYRIGRYTDTMDLYYRWMRGLADGEHAEFRPYLEQCILNGLKYRVTQGVHPDMTAEESAAYRETVYELIRRTEDVEFSRTPAVSSLRRLYLMRIKHGEEALDTMEIRRGRIYSRGYDMGALPKNTFDLTALSMGKHAFALDGSFRFAPHKDARLIAYVNGASKPVPLQHDDAATLTSLTGDVVVQGFAFHLELPLDARTLEVRFALRFKGQDTPLTPRTDVSAMASSAKRWDAEMTEDGALLLQKLGLFGGKKERTASVTAPADPENITYDQAVRIVMADLGCTEMQARSKLAAAENKHGMGFRKCVSLKAHLVPDARMGAFKKSVVAEVAAEDAGIAPGQAFVKMDDLRSRFGLSHNRIATKGLLQCASEEELLAAVEDIRATDRRYVDRICEATGQTAEEVERRGEHVRREFNVSIQQYCNYGLYLLPDEEVQAWAESKREERSRTVAMIAGETGWAKRRVRKHMTACSVRYNVDPTHYLSYRCWNLTDADLEGFATQTQSAALDAKYNTGDKSVLDSKVCFVNAYGDLMGRKAWVNRDTSFEEFQQFAEGLTAVFCKPESLSFGVGAHRLEVGEDLRVLYDDLMGREKLVVEEYVEQHPALAEFAASCANTLRFVNIIKDGEYAELGCFVRLGRGDSAVDNYGSGGIAAAVNMATGVVETPGVDKFGGCHAVHPVSGKPIVGFRIPHWQAVRDLARRALEHVDGINYVGWDIAVREDGPVLIEGNSHSDIRTYQACWAYVKRGTKYLYDPYLED